MSGDLLRARPPGRGFRPQTPDGLGWARWYGGGGARGTFGRTLGRTGIRGPHPADGVESVSMKATEGADPFGTARLRRGVLDAWGAGPARFREDANAEEDLALGGYRDRLVVELAQNAADAAARARVPGLPVSPCTPPPPATRTTAACWPPRTPAHRSTPPEWSP